jgi:hypothetical protein
MIDQLQLSKWQKALDAKLPILGAMQRRGAVTELVQHVNEPGVIPLLWKAAELSDSQASSVARAAIESLPRGDGQDTLCEMAIADPAGSAAKICIAKQYRPRDHERACLMLFVTEQLDAYFKEDDDFQNLRLQYDKADAKIKSRVMEIVRKGDRRCQPFVVRPRKKLRECTEAEIRLALQSCVKHKDWARLFKACLELPMKYSFPAFQRLAKNPWQPDTPEAQALYKAICDGVTGKDAPTAPTTPTPPPATSSVFDKWLAAGRTGELAAMSEGQLLEKMKSADPPDGVSIVGALAMKVKPGSPAAKAVADNEHWMIRLAGHLTGLLTPDLMERKDGEDPNYWVNMLAKAEGVLDFWPSEATPADLEKMNSAPPEAFTGKLGAVRCVLRTILAHQVTGIQVVPMEVQVDVDAVEIVMAE